MAEIVWNAAGRPNWTQTFTGRQFFPLEPDANAIVIEDIAHALSSICRYGGHARDFYSVAEHSVLLSHFVDPEYAREGLLHDAAEAYIGDMVRPLKRQIPQFSEAEARIEIAIAERFGTRNTPEARAAWKQIDDRILVDEIYALLPNPDPRLSTLAPLGAEILCYPPKRAELLFLLRFYELFPEHAPVGLDVSLA